MTDRRALPLALLLITGCTAEAGRYPSLSPRPIEARALFTEPERETTPSASPDPAMEARIAASLATLDAGEREFAAALAAAKQAGASSPAVGSEAWVAAQQALTILDAARQPATAAIADLDALRLDAAQRPIPVDTVRLDAAHARASAVADRQRADYDAAAARLPVG